MLVVGSGARIYKTTMRKTSPSRRPSKQPSTIRKTSPKKAPKRRKPKRINVVRMYKITKAKSRPLDQDQVDRVVSLFLGGISTMCSDPVMVRAAAAWAVNTEELWRYLAVMSTAANKGLPALASEMAAFSLDPAQVGKPYVYRRLAKKKRGGR